MKISALDIRKQVFRKTLRGYDEHEVNAFLELIASQVEDFHHENRTLRDQLSAMDVQVENYQKIEEALRNALVTAEKVARETKQNADKEVEITLRDAQHRAQRSVESARGILGGVQNDLLDLARQRRDYVTRFRLLVETQLRMLDLKQVEFEDEDNLRRLEEIQRELFERGDADDRSGTKSAALIHEPDQPERNVVAETVADLSIGDPEYGVPVNREQAAEDRPETTHEETS